MVAYFLLGTIKHFWTVLILLFFKFDNLSVNYIISCLLFTSSGVSQVKKKHIHSIDQSRQLMENNWLLVEPESLNPQETFINIVLKNCTCMCFLVGTGAGTSGGVLSYRPRVHQGQGEPAQNVTPEHWRERGVEDKIRIDLCASSSLFLSFLLSLSYTNICSCWRKRVSSKL